MTNSNGALSLIEKAKENVLSSNNGYAFIGHNADVASALEQDGFVVIMANNLHGVKEYKAFTKSAQEALRTEPFGVSTYKSFSMPIDLPDCESMILDRQAKYID